MSDTLIQVHLGEKTKFFAQRFARSSGLTLGAFVENCVSTVLSVTEITTGGRTFTCDELDELLWSEHAADRFLHVAAHARGTRNRNGPFDHEGAIALPESF